jgi:FkbM family methyltransferase
MNDVDFRVRRGNAAPPVAADSPLLRAARAGARSFLGVPPEAARSAALSQADAAAAAKEGPAGQADPAEAGAASSVWIACRRAGRRALRVLKPLALPVLHRFEWRVRSAVEKTSLVGTAARLEELLTAQLAANEATAQQVQALSREVTQLRSLIQAERDVAAPAHQDRTERQLADLAGGQARTVRRLEEMWAGLSERSDILLSRTVIPLGAEILARTPYGWLLAPASDSKLAAMLFEGGGVLESGTTRVLNGLLREGDTVLDIGANLGLMTLPAARKVGELGRVIAVEPTPRLVGLLRRTLALNDVDDRVVVHACAAGARPDRQTFHIAPVCGHSSLLPLADVSERIEVDIRPLDALVPAGTRVDLVKIDVEGFELPAWQGMPRILAENPDLAAIVEFGPEHLRRSGTATEDWLRDMTAPGFTAYEIDAFTGVCRPLRRTGLDEVVSINLLMLRHPPARYPGVSFA